MRTMCWYSVFSVRRNLRRAGTLKKRSRTSTLVPEECDAGAGAVTTAVASIHCPGMLRLRGARHQRQRGNGRDTRQRFAAKPQGRDVFKILERGNLAGGVPCQGQRHFASFDADAIVANADQSTAAALQFNLDALRAGIQCIFHQLLDHGGRTFDHLAGGDLTDQGVGQ